MLKEIFIAGASARSVAQSAVRCGLSVAAADLFCDRDLEDCGQGRLVEDYPRGILSISNEISPRTWVYTGGLENLPDLVDAVSCRHELWGNPGSVLSQIRDPWQLAHVLHRARLRYPEIGWGPVSEVDGTWIHKPLRSCGGMHIRLHTGRTSDRTTASGQATRRDRAAATCGHGDGDADPPSRFYYQRRRDGSPHGVVYVGCQGRATLLGVTRQLVGSRWAGASGYRYAGSIGPLACEQRKLDEFQRIGDCLAEAFGLVGIFGVDAIVDGDQVWTIEVNPRFTASVELIERATGVAAMEIHGNACRGQTFSEPRRNHTEKLYGKAIAYARHDCVIDAAFYRRLDRPDARTAHPEYADLPRVGTTIFAGHPILTVFAEGHDIHAVYRGLKAKAQAVRALCS